MEKLIELLNKYEEKKEKYVWSEYDLCYRPDRIILAISKHYGFIERLVREGKIDYWSEGWRNTPNYYESTEFGQKIFYDIEKLIIHLSIQDKPIEYLCSILKE